MVRDKKEGTIVEHLIEFRKRFVLVILFFFGSFLVSLLFSGELYRALTSQFEQKLLVLGPNDILWIYVTLASLVAFTMTLPFTTYQIWAFIRPALHNGEGRTVLIYVPATFFCFFIGLVFGFYWVSPALLKVLLSLGEDLFETQLTAQNYLAFLLHTTIPVAILFELPVIISFLTSIGILAPQFLIKYRRYAYFILLLVAVVITPADFISDLVMTVPLVAIYEISVVFSTLIYKKQQKKGENHGNLT